MLSLDLEIKLKYILMLSLCMIISNRFKNIESNIKLAAISMFMIVTISLGQTLISGFNIYELSISVIEGIILFLGVYIFTYGIDLILNINSKTIITPEETIAISFILVFSIMGVGDISIFSISLKSVFASVLILLSATIGGITSGAISGVIVGISFMINGITSAIYMGAYSFAGLISGGFSKLSKYICVISYILSWIIVYAYTDDIYSNINVIQEILIASIIVLLIPKGITSKFEKIFNMNATPNEVVDDYIQRNKDITNNKLINMYKAYDELGKVFDNIREKEKVIDNNDIASIIDMIYKDKCSGCSMRRRCWEIKFNHTYTLMGDILGKLEELGEIKTSDISTEFNKECIDPEEVVKISNYYYKMFVIDYNWGVKFAESRKLIANQIKNVSLSIENLSKEFESNTVINLEKEKEIYDELQRYNIKVDKVTYLTKSNNDFEIIIDKKICKSGQECETKIVNVISKLVGVKLSPQKIGCRALGGRCRIKLGKAQKLSAITETSKMSRSGYLVCGDNQTYMEISDGKYIIALSDGMGKGKKAHKESAITIDILEKMIDSDIDEDIVINTINNMLLLKSEEEEIFSTLDLGIIDLKRGMLNTVKMGACSTYIKRNENKVDLVSSSSFPVGILSDIKLDKKSVKVEAGDIIVMVSDGILDAGIKHNLGDNWLIYFLKDIESSNPKDISKLILEKSLDIQDGVIEDDMTVLVTKICKG